jgi:hypothetical protein
MPARRLAWKIVAIGGLLTAVLFDVDVGLCSHSYLARNLLPASVALGIMSSRIERPLG